MSFFNKFRSKEFQKSYHQEILDSICDLLNTKTSFGAYQKDFGINSYIYLSSSGNVSRQIINEIESCLHKYETRINVINIKSTSSKDSFSLSFVIECKIQQQPHAFQLAFQTQQRQFKKGENI